MCILTLSAEYCPEGSSQCYRARKRKKIVHTGVEEIKVSLLSHDMIVYVENTTVSTKQLLQGLPHGQVVKFPCSAASDQGSDPGHRHGTAHQVTLRRHATCHN